MPNYYLVILYNSVTGESVIGLTMGYGTLEAEDKGKKWAKDWGPKGYSFRNVEWLNLDRLNSEIDVMLIAEEGQPYQTIIE